MPVKTLTFSIFFLLTINSSFANDWVSLFNGKDFSGWIVKAIPADQDKEFWSIVDGVIQINSLGQKDHDYVWLMTEKEYGNFIIQLQFQAFKDSPGNSGVQIRSRYDDAAGWLDGPQVDINPPAYWRCGMIWDETRENKRWLYPEIPKGTWVDSTMAVPGINFYYSDENPYWNDIRLKTSGHLERLLYGQQVTASSLFKE